VKYASNTFLALKISFANEVAALAEALGADHEKVLMGVGLDWRIGGAFLKPGPGFGGSCLPKDLSGFIAVAGSMGQPATLARAVREVNDVSRANLVAKLEAALGPLPGKRVGVLGLAFKAGTDDVRHSPALALVEDLVALGATVRAHDPVARVPGLGDAQVDDPYEAASGADALVVATAWPEYGELDSGRLQRCMEGHVVVDAVNLLDAASFGARGLDVYGVGGGHAMSVAPVLWRPLEWMIEAQPTVALDEACPDDVDALAGR
jgi:UDPglucose 6-dehydrogenase